MVMVKNKRGRPKVAFMYTGCSFKTNLPESSRCSCLQGNYSCGSVLDLSDYCYLQCQENVVANCVAPIDTNARKFRLHCRVVGDPEADTHVVTKWHSAFRHGDSWNDHVADIPDSTAYRLGSSLPCSSCVHESESLRCNLQRRNSAQAYERRKQEQILPNNSVMQSRSDKPRTLTLFGSSTDNKLTCSKKPDALELANTCVIFVSSSNSDVDVAAHRKFRPGSCRINQLSFDFDENKSSVITICDTQKESDISTSPVEETMAVISVNNSLNNSEYDYQVLNISSTDECFQESRFKANGGSSVLEKANLKQVETHAPFSDMCDFEPVIKVGKYKLSSSRFNPSEETKFSCGQGNEKERKPLNRSRSKYLTHYNINEFFCRTCLLLFPTQKALKQHKRALPSSHHNFQCQFCHRLFNSEGQFLLHLKQIHKLQFIVPSLCITRHTLDSCGTDKIAAIEVNIYNADSLNLSGITHYTSSLLQQKVENTIRGNDLIVRKKHSSNLQSVIDFGCSFTMRDFNFDTAQNRATFGKTSEPHEECASLSTYQHPLYSKLPHTQNNSLCKIVINPFPKFEICSASSEKLANSNSHHLNGNRTSDTCVTYQGNALQCLSTTFKKQMKFRANQSLPHGNAEYPLIEFPNNQNFRKDYAVVTDCQRSIPTHCLAPGKDTELKSTFNEIRKYICLVCNQKCNSLASLKYHEESHSDNVYNCAFCSKTFKHQNNLKMHERSHQKRKFSCGQCEKSYLRKFLLIRHIQEDHMNMCKYECRYCTKTFPKYRLLSEHRRKIHYKSQPIFTCDICQGMFARKEHLKLHIRQHTLLPRNDYCSLKKENGDYVLLRCLHCTHLVFFQSYRSLRWHYKCVHKLIPTPSKYACKFLVRDQHEFSGLTKEKLIPRRKVYSSKEVVESRLEYSTSDKLYSRSNFSESSNCHYNYSSNLNSFQSQKFIKLPEKSAENYPVEAANKPNDQQYTSQHFNGFLNLPSDEQCYHSVMKTSESVVVEYNNFNDFFFNIDISKETNIFDLELTDEFKNAQL